MTGEHDSIVNLTAEEREAIDNKILSEQAEIQEREREVEREEAEAMPLPKVTQEDIAFVIDTITKEAKYDESSIKQLLYGMNSAFTRIPISHTVNSKDSGAGKSYLLNLVGDYFPTKHVMLLAGASAKALLHRQGVMVIKDADTGELRPVEPIIEELEEELEGLDPHNKENTGRIREIKSEVRSLMKNQQKLIDLDNTIIIIQDTPEDALLVNLMSLSSQDSQKNQEYIFADKSSSGKIIQGSNIIRGMPVIFTTRVIDDTKHVRFEETKRRSINVTPNVTNQKIKAANRLIGMKYGLLPEEYDEKVVSREDKEKAKRIIAIIVEKLKAHSEYLKAKESGIKIPFESSITHSIPSDNVWGMTVTDRTMRYLSIITKVNMDSRPRFVNTEIGAIYPISTFEDLVETLALMELAASNIRPYVAIFYNCVFVPSYADLPTEPKKRLSEYNGRVVEQETYVDLTVEELTERTKIILGFKPSGREMREKYLYPLVNQGLINYSRSVVDGRENLYFPADKDLTKVFSLFANNDDLRLTILDPPFYPSAIVLEKCLGSFVKYDGEECLENKVLGKYRLEDANGTEITVHELIHQYLGNPEICFKKGFDDTGLVDFMLDNSQEQDRELTVAHRSNLNYATQILTKHL